MMEYIYIIREYLKIIYAKFDMYIVALAKFLFAFVALTTINNELGFLTKIDDQVIVILVSLVCALLPWGVTAVMSAIFILGHFYALSLELLGVGLILFIVMFCMYLHFGTGDSIYIVLTLVLFFIDMPYIIPLFAGLTAGAITVAAPVSFGIIMYYFIKFAASNTEVLGASDMEGMLDRFKFIIDYAFQDRQMILMIVAFAVTIVLVYTIRRLTIDYAWLISIIFGVTVNMIILIIGRAMLNANISIASLILGSIISIALMIVLQMFIFAVDYRRKVNVQFEDEDYVYYVKAVPKVKYELKSKKIEKSGGHAPKKPVKRVGKKIAQVKPVKAPLMPADKTDNNLHEDKK